MSAGDKVCFRRVVLEEVERARNEAVDRKTEEQVRELIEVVRDQGDQGLRMLAERFGDIETSATMVLDRQAIEASLDEISKEDRELLERVAGRIERFARTQRDALQDVEVAVPGGVAGHRAQPVEVAGCYAPGGRFPLPSSVLMTAVTARAAGVEQVWVASPKPTKHTVAAAAIAGADAMLCVGGAQAIAALAYGTESVARADVIVGPGNRWVTAAKKILQGQVAIDMLAGPSELLVVADESADIEAVAADLLAQAEHDVDAQVTLVATVGDVITYVEEELEKQIGSLPTAANAHASLRKALAIEAKDPKQVIEVCNRAAPEHLQLSVTNPEAFVPHLRAYGGLFYGKAGAEVFGDYGFGPNHVLPTGGTGRFEGGLSVFHFLRTRTYLRIDEDGPELQSAIDDSARLARLEGLEAHARAAEKRKK